MPLNSFLSSLSTQPENVSFADTMAIIDQYYEFSATAFENADVNNAAGDNNGSCKIFAFGLLNDLSEQQTLHCFGDFYRKDVLDNPNANNHQNIRNFIECGWGGVRFEGAALVPK